MTENAILYDATKCTACRGCQVACKQWNMNDEAIPTVENGVQSVNRGSYENPPDLSPQTWIKMKFTETETADGQVRWLFTRQSCMHCTDAACIKVCPNGSLYHNDLGFVEYNKDTCTGCGHCIDACPFGIPRSTRNILTGIAKMDKCTACTTQGLDRIHAGMTPACVKTCPTSALEYGTRDSIISLGKERVAILQSAGWSDAQLYGENTLGGLHVMYVLDEKPEVYGLPAAPVIPLTVSTWKDILQPVGWIAGGLALVGLGVNYIVARANARKEE